MIGPDQDKYIKYVNDKFLSKGWSILFWVQDGKFYELQAPTLLTKHDNTLFTYIKEWASKIKEESGNTLEQINNKPISVNTTDKESNLTFTKEILAARKNCTDPLLDYISFLETKALTLECMLNSK